MKSFKQTLAEASYEVKINGLPDMYIDSKSPVTIKKQLRKQLRQPDDLVSITRITKADKINVFRDRIKSAPLGEVAGPSDCWDGYKKDGTQAGTGKNKGKRVNKCVPENMKSFKEHAGIDEALVGLGLAVADKAIRYGPKAYKAVKKAIPVAKKVYNKVKTYIKPKVSTATNYANKKSASLGYHATVSGPPVVHTLGKMAGASADKAFAITDLPYKSSKKIIPKVKTSFKKFYKNKGNYTTGTDE